MTLQVVNHYSPLESGVALLPLTLVMLVLSARSGRLAASIGPRLQMSVGPVVVGVGMVLLARLPTSTSYFSGVLPGRCGHRPGPGHHRRPVDLHRPRFLDAVHAGMASAVNNDVARLGSLIAVAVLPALGGISGSSYLHPLTPWPTASRGRWSSPDHGVSWAGSPPPSASETRPGATPHRRRTGPSARYCALEATPLRRRS